jgi:hypothetical protein
MKREHAYKLREMLHKASASLPDEDALEAVELFPVWKADVDYWNGDRVRDPVDELLYKLIVETPEGHPHHSQSDWPPRLVPAIWVMVDNPAEEWPEWKQPQGGHDAYKAGRKVSHNGKHWINIYGDGNIWEPGVYGWEEVK